MQIGGMTDDETWYRALAGVDRDPLFGLPPETMQNKTVGKSGHNAMRDAWMFWQFIRRMAAQHATPVIADTRILDFGVSWGRILRYFLRDTAPEYLAGVDVTPEFLSEARNHLPGYCDLRLSRPMPPLPHSDNSVDIIYAFSVFSHLPEHIARTWAFEFQRILKPGGIACLTTRPRRHLHSDLCKRLAKDPIETHVTRYDNGEFVFFAEYGGLGLSEDIYGEAIIPPRYIENNWPLELISFEEKYSETYLQPCFVLRKR